MVYGWGLWMRALPEGLGTISSDLAESIVDTLAARPLRAPPPRALEMGRWQAFRSMFYPHWDPPLREERRLRWFAGSLSVLMHLLFALLLVLVALVQVPPPPPEAGDSSRVQVEFLGEGTPEEEGGGAPGAQADPQQTGAVQAAVAEPVVPPASSESAQASSLPQRDQPQPSPPAAQQTLQVTETQTPNSVFVLPPTTLRTPDFVPPQMTTPELGVPMREVTISEAPPAQRELPQRELAVPQIAERVLEVREREIPAPLPQIRSVQVPARAITPPEVEVQARTPGVREMEITLPTPAAGSSRATSSASVPGAADARAPADARGARPGATAAGPAAANRAGALPSTRRGDDWDDSTRNTPGAPGDGVGLFNADGSARLPSDSGAGQAPRAGPPGSRQAQQVDADRASKWLERPDYPYQPTMFDKYWVPNESLLAEWVRSAIREVEMPIPGTGKKVRCVVSILQAGGACGLYDPNLSEQPASARPPPDIPIKRNPIPTDS